MSNEMSPQTRHIVSGLAAVATVTLLMSTLVNSFDPRLLQDQSASAPSSAVTAALRRNALIRKV
jgi:hypothetical protein